MIYIKVKNNQMYITYSPNELVYVKGIGYATLLHCGSNSNVLQKMSSVPPKKQSIYFDPDLFNSDHDSTNSKKSKSQEEKGENKIVQSVEVKMEEVCLQGQVAEQMKVQRNVNLVKARLSDNQTLIFTPDTNLSKSIIVIVKPLLITTRSQIAVQIQISKTIDTLKKLIFQQLDQPIANYYNIKLFTTHPLPSELSVPSKTISQYLIKDGNKIVLTADYAFGITPVSIQPNSKNKITINNMTINSTKTVEELKKADSKVAIPLPTLEAVLNTEAAKQSESKTQQSKQLGEAQQNIQLQNPAYHALLNVELSSGKRYWQIKVQQLPTEEDDLVVGVCMQSLNKICQYLWGYHLVSAKKVHLQRQSNILIEHVLQPYGYVFKQNDVCGIQLVFKRAQVLLTFYNNGICCGKAFQIDLNVLNIDNRQMIPFINIGGQCQVTLDSKAMRPLTSYRFR